MPVERGIKAAIGEVKGTLSKLIIFDTFINAILVFLISLFLFSLFSLHFIYPVVVSIAFLLYSLRKRLGTNKIRMVEQHYSYMNEKLRTAAEYNDPDNSVVKELHAEVLSDLKKVEESEFVNEKRIYIKSVAIVLLSFLILFLSPLSFGFLDITLGPDDSGQQDAGDAGVLSDSGNSKIRFAVGPQDTGLKKASDDIYGTATVAKLGDEELKIKISPAGTELSVSEMEESQPPDFSEAYPNEVAAVASANYEESIPKEDLELVKNYFNSVSGK